ncbi:DUF5953 family protein [Archangium sp.]|uniref:DUF5953 family protein n=1 Tax=Archangium sp. TaxID=1872627 RepID=UPI00286B3E8D|nr:DUF5953 family protein [Archangium sp.]
MTKRKRLGIIVYAPALVGNDRRALDSVHGMEKALPGLRLEWRLSEGGRPIALPQRDTWLVAIWGRRRQTTLRWTSRIKMQAGMSGWCPTPPVNDFHCL